MADGPISGLTAAAAALGTHEFAVNEGGVSKKDTLDMILAYLQTKGMPMVRRQTADHAISTIAATEITDLEIAGLVPGTYDFTYKLLVQSATLTVSPMLGVNFTGTAAVRNMGMWWWDAGGLATGTGVADDVGVTAGSMLAGIPVTAFSTTAPNMGHAGGVATINANILVIIEGLMIVTATGNLELWHGSETATSTTVKAGSSLKNIRTA